MVPLKSWAKKKEKTTTELKVLKTGHVPTTEFWKVPREENYYKLNTKYSEAIEYMLLDPWKIEKEKLKKMDVLYTRGERAHWSEKKSRICKCILNGIKDMIEQQSNIVIGEEWGELNNW